MNKKEYTAPTLTVVTFKTERGYAASITGYGPNATLLGLLSLNSDEGYNDQGQQNWHESDYFGDTW